MCSLTLDIVDDMMLIPGSCIKCYLNNAPDKICPAEVGTCAIRQSADVGLITFCEKGEVGCSVQSAGLTCYCNSNK